MGTDQILALRAESPCTVWWWVPTPMTAALGILPFMWFSVFVWLGALPNTRRKHWYTFWSLDYCLHMVRSWVCTAFVAGKHPIVFDVHFGDSNNYLHTHLLGFCTLVLLLLVSLSTRQQVFVQQWGYVKFSHSPHTMFIPLQQLNYQYNQGEDCVSEWVSMVEVHPQWF